MSRAIRFAILCASVLVLTPILRAEAPASKSKPNVIILLLDTTRADHLGAYGYDKNTTPNLDKFAAENIRYEYAVTAAPWTPPSVSSILTGLYASSHGMMPPNDREEAKQSTSKLPSAVDTLAEVLKRSGYLTAGISPNPWITAQFNFAQGFDDFRYRHRVRADEINKEAKDILKGFKAKGQPFFLYAHYLDPHDPYDPPAAYREKFSGNVKGKFNYPDKMIKNIGLYDGELNFLDEQLGDLFSYLKGEGLYDNTLIVVVGDHGEQFMEHGDHRHGFQLHNEEVHVPLLVHTGLGSDHGRVFKDTVSTIDIFPTALEFAGIKVPAGHPGISLLDSARLSNREGVYTEIRRRYDQRGFVTAKGEKIIFSVPYDEKKPELTTEASWKAPQMVGVYDRHKNYDEQQGLNDPMLTAKLKGYFGEMETYLASNKLQLEEEKAQVNDETLDQLKSLGYLQ